MCAGVFLDTMHCMQSWLNEGSTGMMPSGDGVVGYGERETASIQLLRSPTRLPSVVIMGKTSRWQRACKHTSYNVSSYVHQPKAEVLSPMCQCNYGTGNQALQTGTHYCNNAALQHKHAWRH
ncbi:jg5527 [Pararge aegeria aegeria]|uniref:Jg5527 protein n=1 Tax=Pararge aegeria aegeria TaxID=348720 RepID=A0A8S4SG50_9NEOP|nr:jg5527 [Pararge aegeria aegeria]